MVVDDFGGDGVVREVVLGGTLEVVSFSGAFTLLEVTCWMLEGAATKLSARVFLVVNSIMQL